MLFYFHFFFFFKLLNVLVVDDIVLVDESRLGVYVKLEIVRNLARCLIISRFLVKSKWNILLVKVETKIMACKTCWSRDTKN